MLRGRHILYILMSLTMLVSGVIRPPGTMLELKGETLTYTLCTGNQIETVTINLDESDDRDIDVSCDAFTIQLTGILIASVEFSATPLKRTTLKLEPLWDVPSADRVWHPYISRAPPLLS